MSSIQVAKIGMGYQTATKRPSCMNCKHGDQNFADRAPPWNTAHWTCKKGGFNTTAMAICSQHEFKFTQQGSST